MSHSTRPSGLIALAVLNFLFGTIGVLTVLGNLISLVMADKLIAKEPKMEEVINNISVAATLLGGVLTALLITSGVGYLKQKKKLGFILGNVAAVTWIVHIIVSATDFNIMESALLLFPILTLTMLNVVFKRDFINP